MTVGYRNLGCSDFSFEISDFKPTLLYSNTQSLIGFSVIPKCVTLNDL